VITSALTFVDRLEELAAAWQVNHDESRGPPRGRMAARLVRHTGDAHESQLGICPSPTREERQSRNAIGVLDARGFGGVIDALLVAPGLAGVCGGR